MAKHARFGPSTLDSLSKCIRFKYYDTDDGAATEGSELHAACEAESVKGLSEDQARMVQACLDYIDGLKQTEGGPKCWDDVKELEVELEDLTFGTADRILTHRAKPIIHVCDYKFIRVEGIGHNFQVRTYGAAYLDKYTIPYLDDPTQLEPYAVHTHVIAPRIDSYERQEHNGYELWKSVREEIEALYARIDNPWNPETPDEVLCAKCARASRCPSVSKTAAVVATRLGLPLPQDFAPNAVVAPKDRAIAQVIAGALDTWATQIKKDNAEWASQDPANVEALAEHGLKYVTRSTGIRVPSEFVPAAIQTLKDRGIPEELILENVTLKLPGIIKAYASIGTESEAEVRAEVRSALEGMVTEGSTKFLQKAKRIQDQLLLEQLNKGA
jgi:hypothetical protein